MKKIFILTILILYTSVIFPSDAYYPEKFEEAEMRLLHKLMRDMQIEHKEKHALKKIYRRNDILFCEGEDPAALENNSGAVLMLRGEYKEAAQIFENAMKHAPLFFPYFYNLGKCYSHMLDYTKAFIYLNKARYMVPEYFLTYLETGRTYESMNKISEAIEFYRTAANIFPKHLETYIALGNAYLKQNREKRAIHYYEYTLSKNPYYANGLIGKAKIQFSRKEYYKAYMTLRIIDISDEDYDKAYHYLYAECCYKLQIYNTAYEQYNKLLEFKHDRFFIRTSIKLIEHKMELSRRLSESKKLEESE